MKTFTLTLSDSASSTALELAGHHGVPVESFLSSQMEDFLDLKAYKNGHTPAAVNSSADRTWPSPNHSAVMPDTLDQVLKVCKYVYRNGTVPDSEVHARDEFRDAVHIVAKEVGVGETTVRDKCCTSRRLGLADVMVTTDTFLAWLCQPEALRDHLCRKFPKFVEEIRQKFSEWLPKRFKTL